MKSKIRNLKGIIDDTLLRSLVGDDEENLLLVYSDFSKSSKLIVQEISAALKERNLKEIQNAAHKLKSSALSVGANDLGQCAKNIELLIRSDRSFHEISIAVEQLNQKFLIVENLISS